MKVLNGIWQVIKEFFSFDNGSCPNCGGHMHQVIGWDKERCEDCNFTRRVW